MKFVLTSFGTRGDVEPCATIGRELLRRGHDVRMAVPPDMVGFVESAGLAAVACGPDSQALLRDEDFVRLSKIQNPITLQDKFIEYAAQVWVAMGTTLTALANGADLLLTGMSEQQGLAANIAEYHGIPLAVLHCFPMPELHSIKPPADAWLDWRIAREAEAAQRRALGLPEATGLSSRRMVERGSLEIQAYDELCFPGLAVEWRGRWPFVGALTLEMPTDADDEVLSWIGAGTPPIYFGFGSTPVTSPADAVATIGAACTELGQRALIYSGVDGFNQIPHFDHVKIVGAVNYAAVFPACRAVVHHGGAGTTAAGLRAGVPSLVLWLTADQPIWAAAVTQLKVGSGRQFSATTRESLIADLRLILTPQYVTRAREIGAQMTKPAESAASAADLLEDTARQGRFG
jgi:UDP:flavonoid glycosyltransferase YjiC (YdhE family)